MRVCSVIVLRLSCEDFPVNICPVRESSYVDCPVRESSYVDFHVKIFL